MTSSPSLLPVGVILAGGRGRRFGVADKSFLELKGQPLISHVIGRLAAQVSDLVINTNSTDCRYQAYGLRLCGDRPRLTPATGPLIGLTSVFQELDIGTDGQSSLLSVPVDTPFLPLDLAHRLSIALSASDACIAYAATAERAHPIVALWGPRSRKPVLELFEQQPNISLHAMVAALNAIRVVFDHGTRDPFFNINCTQDLKKAERIYGSTDNH